MSWVKGYELAGSLEEAEALLEQPGWMLMGGGSRIVAKKPEGVDKLVDLMLLGLDGLRREAGQLRIGARVRLAQIVEIEEWSGLLGKSVLSLTHSPNMRNQMTLAGETAWRSPVNELQVALAALDATIHRNGHEPVPVADYLAGERKGIITEFVIPLPAAGAWHFDRIAPGDGARPLLAFAAAASFAGDDLESIGIAVGNLGPDPQRLRTLEARLAGIPIAALAGEGLRGADREGLAAFESPGATVANKWEWLETLVSRCLAETAKAAGQ